jgi:dolichyl-phosphate beta-glucosyltransferase
MVTGSRNLSDDGYEGYTFLRKIMSKTYIKVLCMVGGFKLSDSQCGCKAFSGKAAKEIFSRCEVNGFAFDFEAILWAGKLGFKITEMPVKIINHRESKVNVIKDTLKMLRDLRRIKKSVKSKVKAEKKAK